MLLRFFCFFLLLGSVARAVDVSTLTGKVVCGYQGWFRCERDGANNGWHHYAANGKFEPGHAHIDLWPDVSELPAADRFDTPFQHADGSTAQVFSSVKASTVNLHFKWMRDYGIDGIFLQRFGTIVRDPRFREPADRVLDHCRAAAAETGRGWALMYDLSGLKPGQMEAVMEDWKHLQQTGRISRSGTDGAYFRHRNRPLVALWGLGFNDRDPMLEDWTRLLRFIRNNPEFGGFSILLGVPYHWRTRDGDALKNPEWHELFKLADIISPWSVGRLATPEDAAGRVEKRLKPDVEHCAALKLDYLPVLFPGFSWKNLSLSRGQEARFDAIPRLGGRFMWSQALAAHQAGASMLYIAMFDELDEGTAIMKFSTSPPVGESRFLSEPGVAGDRYLRLTGDIGRLLRGEIPSTPEPP